MLNEIANQKLTAVKKKAYPRQKIDPFGVDFKGKHQRNENNGSQLGMISFKK